MFSTSIARENLKGVLIVTVWLIRGAGHSTDCHHSYDEGSLELLYLSICVL